MYRPKHCLGRHDTATSPHLLEVLLKGEDLLLDLLILQRALHELLVLHANRLLRRLRTRISTNACNMQAKPGRRSILGVHSDSPSI